MSDLVILRRLFDRAVETAAEVAARIAVGSPREDGRHIGPVVNAAWSTDGARIAMASSDGTAWVHWLRAEDLQARACQHVARNLSEGEWERYVGIDPYQATCDGKPIPGQDFQQLGITD